MLPLKTRLTTINSSKLSEITFIPVYHSILQLWHIGKENLLSVAKFIFISFTTFALVSLLGYYQLALSCLKWIVLGILSSVGFGFGMHTFVLFLAPHIAAVTNAAGICNSLNFKDYPSDLGCTTVAIGSEVTFLMILQRVALESFMWGLGTAIGELPPYLAARLKAQTTVRNTGGDNHGVEQEAPGWESRMIKIINKVGFIGILLCAAIPNPLFDAAGVASGIAQVPFLKFFGATFIGKAIIKVLLQTSFVIFIFHSKNLDALISKFFTRLGEFAPRLNDLNLYRSLVKFLEEQRRKVEDRELNTSAQTSLISTFMNWLICLIMIIFVISVINSLDKQYKERIASKHVRRTE